VLSGRGLCDELITRSEESYRLWCVVVCDLETSRIGAPYIYIYDISSLRVNTVSTRSPEVGGPPLNPRLFIQYNHSYPPTLEAVSPSVTSERTILLLRVT